MKQNCPCAQHKSMRDSGDIAPHILNLGKRCGQLPASRPYRFIPGKKNRRHAVNRRPDGPQIRPGWFGEAYLLGIWPRFFGRPTRDVATIPIELPWRLLAYLYSFMTLPFDSKYSLSCSDHRWNNWQTKTFRRKDVKCLDDTWDMTSHIINFS